MCRRKVIDGPRGVMFRFEMRRWPRRGLELERARCASPWLVCLGPDGSTGVLVPFSGALSLVCVSRLLLEALTVGGRWVWLGRVLVGGAEGTVGLKLACSSA